MLNYWQRERYDGDRERYDYSTERYDGAFSGIISKIKTPNGGKKLFHEKNYAKIGINTDDDLPLNKQLEFPTLAVIIRCVLQNGGKLYPQIYLNECSYELRVV